MGKLRPPNVPYLGYRVVWSGMGAETRSSELECREGKLHSYCSSKKAPMGQGRWLLIRRVHCNYSGNCGPVVTNCWQVEIGHAGNICTTEVCKCYRSGFPITPTRGYQYTTGYEIPEQARNFMNIQKNQWGGVG